MSVTKKELQAIIDLHAAWLGNRPGGKRANLRDADLRGADLRDADLRGADLCGANLCGANLCGANLCGANLRGADLRGADLRDANLCDADLCGADLCGANLRDANLRDANLRDANLCADLPKGFRIARLDFGGWSIRVLPDRTAIGCQEHPNSDWLRWTPDEVDSFAEGAKEYWQRHRESICAVIRDVMQDGAK